MANILADELVVPELVQHGATPEKIAAAALEFLKDPARLASQRERLAELRRMLGEPGVAARAAKIIKEQ
jgi:Lipid A disaccharide synthetase